jgi:sugar/nucleoside kinase (ribokinase family)
VLLSRSLILSAPRQTGQPSLSERRGISDAHPLSDLRWESEGYHGDRGTAPTRNSTRRGWFRFTLRMSVLIAGSIALDHIKTPVAEYHHLLGGSAAYAAVSASFFGPTQLVGVVGRDFPDEHMELFKTRQIDLEGLEMADGETFTWSGEYEQNMNNRKTLSVALNVFEHFTPKLPENYRATPYVLLGNIAPSLQQSVRRQLSSPKFVVADTMDIWISMARADLVEMIKSIDMLILNDSEARQFTEEDNLIRAGRMIAGMGPRYVAVKKGEHGCLLFGQKGEFFSTSAFPLEAIKDPTGAGDCFAGGLIGHLARTDDTSFANLKEAIIQGTLVASFCVEEFSLRRLEKLAAGEIEARRQAFGTYIA